MNLLIKKILNTTEGEAEYNNYDRDAEDVEK